MKRRCKKKHEWPEYTHALVPNRHYLARKVVRKFAEKVNRLYAQTGKR